MERKKFNRGTVTGGIIRIVISVVMMIISVIVLSSAIKSWDSENVAGGVFMCIISIALLCAGVYFIIEGIKVVIDGKKSLEVVKKGHSENGRIIDLTATEVTETNGNGYTSHYTVYNLKFEYNSDNGELCESQEQVSEKAYGKLQTMKIVPILVYQQRAVFDRKKFEAENFNK